jgi:NAD(P)-dependent dehydrogenase (short-subunit alcohol dehydrogenase family)
MIPGRFAGKVIVVTGAGTGIGLGIARRLAAEGGAVVIAELNAESGTAAAAQINAQGGQARFVQTDVTDEASATAMTAAAVDWYGRLDVLVNNAGASPRKRLADMTTRDWHAILDLNLTGQYLCAQHAIPHLRAQSGANIVNIASLHAYATVPGLAAYAAAKGGVVALTGSMAIEYAPVRVNGVAPGVIETEAWFAAVGDVEAARRQRLGFHPVGRLGTVEDIAAAVSFLACDEAAFITGQTLRVDGGLLTILYRDPA